MGRDKARLIVDGTTLAERTAALLRRVTATAVEVGPGVSGLPWSLEDTRGDGPLVAIAQGRRMLQERGHDGPALVLACDLPLLSEALLRFLVERSAPQSVVPVVEERPQPLCAKWSPRDLDSAGTLAKSGVRSVRFLSDLPETMLLDESAWRETIDGVEFSDVDYPDDLRRLGIDP
jgi:molybdopterin-guanine dinucleotide biosynthesis protein A